MTERVTIQLTGSFRDLFVVESARSQTPTLMDVLELVVQECFEARRITFTPSMAIALHGVLNELGVQSGAQLVMDLLPHESSDVQVIPESREVAGSGG